MPRRELTYNNTMYTAFISSVYTTLLDERKVVIDTLLRQSVFPVCMENFVVANDARFRDIERKIDISDCVIIIMGSQYGSTDDEGISWTQREYEYAKECGKSILVIVCDDLTQNINKIKAKAASGSPEDFEKALEEDTDLTQGNKKQIIFYTLIHGFAKPVLSKEDIERVVNTYISDNIRNDLSKGWRRITCLEGGRLKEWQEAHKRYDVNGEWYHIHLNDKQQDYIRIGTVNITQEFTPEAYSRLRLVADNYSIEKINTKDRTITSDQIKYTKWQGDYTIDFEDDEIIGMYQARRTFDNGKFGDVEVERGTTNGIHIFTLTGANEKPKILTGTFHDAAPKRKHGTIYLFRTEEARFNYLEKARFKYLRENNADIFEEQSNG